MTARSETDAARARARTFALVIAAVFVLIAVGSWWGSRENLREGSREISGGGAPLHITRAPTTYRAVFRVENRAGGELNVTTEKVWFSRPFKSRIETWRGAPPGTARLSIRESAFGILASTSTGAGAPLNITVPPGLASGDLRIDAVIEDAVRDKTVLRRERREVNGRTCQVYRAGGPVFAGDITPYKALQGDYADVCIDSNGIVLEEYWVDKGKLIRRRVVTDLDIDPPISEKLLSIDIPINPDLSRGLVQRLNERNLPKSKIPTWTLPSTPKGFTRLGRYAVVLSDQALPPNSGIPAGGALSTTDVYVRGPDVLIVDQDPSLALRASLENRLSKDTKLPNLEDSILIVDGRMSEVRGRTGDGSFIRIFGTLPPDELLRLAGSLAPSGS